MSGTPASEDQPAIDAGDRTAQRYRYQWTYAGIVCCMLLDDSEGVIEVFCEHHEDVLTKHADGTFSGLQIKTRASDQPPWKTTDEAVLTSCVRFARLEAQFPERFRAFRFLTNHPLFAGGNAKDFGHVLDVIADTPSDIALPATIVAFVARIAKDAGCSQNVVIRALAKARAIDTLPKIADIEMRLVNAVTSTWDKAEECSHGLVIRVARGLAAECARASSLAHEDILPAYLPVTKNPDARELMARLEEKRFDRSRVLKVLDSSLIETATLDGDTEHFAEPGIGVTTLLIKKLEAGGFSVVSCNSATDLRDKADYLGIAWTKKHGRTTGLQRYGHVRSLVLSDAARAFELNKSTTQPFGLAMLAELRSRFVQRRAEGAPIFGASNEHLEGFAYSLTSECKVQWSLDRPWENN